MPTPLAIDRPMDDTDDSVAVEAVGPGPIAGEAVAPPRRDGGSGPTACYAVRIGYALPPAPPGDVERVIGEGDRREPRPNKRRRPDRPSPPSRAGPIRIRKAIFLDWEDARWFVGGSSEYAAFSSFEEAGKYLRGKGGKPSEGSKNADVDGGGPSTSSDCPASGEAALDDEEDDLRYLMAKSAERSAEAIKWRRSYEMTAKRKDKGLPSAAVADGSSGVCRKRTRSNEECTKQAGQGGLCVGQGAKTNCGQEGFASPGGPGLLPPPSPSLGGDKGTGGGDESDGIMRPPVGIARIDSDEETVRDGSAGRTAENNAATPPPCIGKETSAHRPSGMKPRGNSSGKTKAGVAPRRKADGMLNSPRVRRKRVGDRQKKAGKKTSAADDSDGLLSSLPTSDQVDGTPDGQEGLIAKTSAFGETSHSGMMGTMNAHGAWSGDPSQGTAIQTNLLVAQKAFMSNMGFGAAPPPDMNAGFKEFLTNGVATHLDVSAGFQEFLVGGAAGDSVDKIQGSPGGGDAPAAAATQRDREAAPRRSDEDDAGPSKTNPKKAPKKPSYWWRKFAELEKYKEENGSVEIPEASEENKGKPNMKRLEELRKWCHGLRHHEHRRMLGYADSGGLTEEQIAKLKDVGLFSAPSYDDMRERLAARKAETGSLEVEEAEDGALYEWASEQKKILKRHFRGKSVPLTEERIQDLISLGYERRRSLSGRKETCVVTDHGSEDSKWDAGLEALVRYREETGGFNFPTGTRGMSKEHRLVKYFVRAQRQDFKALKEGKESALTARRLQRLHSVGLDLSPKPDRVTWEERMKQLREFVEEHGHCKPNREHPLGNFVLNLRYRYKEHMRGKKTAFTDKRIKDLEDVGFVFQAGKTPNHSAAKKSWDGRFEELVAFREEHGHTRVPQLSGTLGDWVRQQRVDYKRMKDGRKTGMTPERALRLGEIDFQFDAARFRGGSHRSID